MGHVGRCTTVPASSKQSQCRARGVCMDSNEGERKEMFKLRKNRKERRAQPRSDSYVGKIGRRALADSQTLLASVKPAITSNFSKNITITPSFVSPVQSRSAFACTQRQCHGSQIVSTYGMLSICKRDIHHRDQLGEDREEE